MKRLYYITDQLDFAEHISEQLSANGIDKHHIHVLSKDETGVVTHHLNGPHILERVDFIHGALTGLIIGLMIAIAALFIGRFVLGYHIVDVGQVATICLLMLFGTWLGGLIGFSHENYHIRRFHRQLKEGRHLMMIDVQPSEEKLVHRIIEHLNEAVFGGEDQHVIM
jgi:hypothetical protein